MRLYHENGPYCHCRAAIMYGRSSFEKTLSMHREKKKKLMIFISQLKKYISDFLNLALNISSKMTYAGVK